MPDDDFDWAKPNVLGSAIDGDQLVYEPEKSPACIVPLIFSRRKML